MATSPPALQSPSSSNGSLPRDISLDQLVEHFLAAKRSLLASQQVTRAQEIVLSARESLSENAVLIAKNTFARRALDKQVEALEAIRYGMSLAEAETQHDFEATVYSLDTADHRLKSTLALLRDTPVEASFRPTTEPPRRLYDFIDESGVEELYESIKGSIDRYETARTAFTEVLGAFDSELERLHDETRLPEEEHEELERVHKLSGGSPVPGLFASLDQHASDTAQHLVGLAKHYDLCLTALRHTEGGGEAITNASEPLGEVTDEHQASRLAGLGVELDEPHEVGPLEPMSEEDRLEMFAVLVKDAGEVEDVVGEIRDALFDMEEQILQVHGYLDLLRRSAERLRGCLNLMKEVSANVPGYIGAASILHAAWEEEKHLLAQKKEDVEGSTDVFVGFYNAYDGLIVEVQRRRHVKAKMEKVMKSALREVERLYEEDLQEREAFKTDQAEYLPSDIWPGLLHPPPRYDFASVDVEAEQLPELAKDIYEKALTRVKARMNPTMKGNN